MNFTCYNILHQTCFEDIRSAIWFQSFVFLPKFHLLPRPQNPELLQTSQLYFYGPFYILFWIRDSQHIFVKYRSAAYTVTKHLDICHKSHYRKVLKKTMKLGQKNIANKTCNLDSKLQIPNSCNLEYQAVWD